MKTMNFLSWIIWVIIGGGATYAATITFLRNIKKSDFLTSTYGSLCVITAFIWSAFEDYYIRLSLIGIIPLAILINSIVISVLYPIFGRKISPFLSIVLFVCAFYALTKYI